MSLNGASVIVNGKVKTNAFQMETDAGAGKVLLSDQHGNGIWSDISSIYNDEDWYFNDRFELYANPRCHKVGILTNSPSEALEVCHRDPTGGIVINQLDSSLQKSEIKFSVCGEEEWAIGSNFSTLRPESFFIWNQKRKRTDFIICDNGWIGIHTNYPHADMDVNGSFKATRIGINTDPPPADSNWKLLVEGGIMAREIKVTTTAFPDYVFGKDYHLMKISELDQFVKTNHRLPGLPSADTGAKLCSPSLPRSSTPTSWG